MKLFTKQKWTHRKQTYGYQSGKSGEIHWPPGKREKRECVCFGGGGSLRRNWEKGIHLFIHHET